MSLPPSTSLDLGRSTSLELGRALLDERLNPFHAVLAGSQYRMAVRLEGEPGVQVRVERLVHSGLDPSEREGRPLRDLRSQCQCLLSQGSLRHHAVDHSHPHRLVGVDLPAQEHELLCPSLSTTTRMLRSPLTLP